jgi:uncharacterized glyoxalase superfamily protein PhnB/predicted kinase
MTTTPELVPLLVVRRAAAAIDFYVRALGAEVLERYEHGAERQVSHADLSVRGARFALTEEVRAFNSDAPPSLSGSPVVMQLVVSDAEAVLASMLRAGASAVFPLQEFLGERMARVRDPFGHLWLLRERVETLSSAEIQRQRDELFARFASAARVEEKPTVTSSEGRMQGRIHLVLGPVGAGKSTYGLALSREHGAVRLTLDDWMTRLFRPDRPEHGVIEWYVERAKRSREQIWATALDVVQNAGDVVLELGLLKAAERRTAYRRADDANVAMSLHFLDAARDIRRERVEERNRSRGATFSMVVPPEIFEMASDLWEPLEPAECEGRDVRFVRTD